MYVSPDLLVIGTMAASTPQQVCSVVKWGHEYQHSTMFVKVVFIFSVYLFTFIGTLCHAVYQLRRYQVMDDGTTMQDFAAFCTGVPTSLCSDDAEDRISAAIQSATGEAVVGVSICW